MTIVIDSKATDINHKESKQNIQLLPCKVYHNGPAKVSKYLVEQDNKTFFRGRGLIGHDVILPAEYNLVVLKKNNSSFETVAKQDSFKIWVHDEAPSVLNSPGMNVESWIELSGHIHSPLK